MATRPYELPQKEYGLWFEVKETIGWTAGAALAEVLYKEPQDRVFDTPQLQPWLSKIRAIAERRGFEIR